MNKEKENKENWEVEIEDYYLPWITENMEHKFVSEWCYLRDEWCRVNNITEEEDIDRDDQLWRDWETDLMIRIWEDWDNETSMEEFSNIKELMNEMVENGESKYGFDRDRVVLDICDFEVKYNWEYSCEWGLIPVIDNFLIDNEV